MEFARAASARHLVKWKSTLARPRGWVCHSCRPNFTVASRRFSSQPPPPADKPYYVTTPIFYVNAAPHLGHMYSMILADVFKRWQTLLGNRAIMITGTDEHGIKVQQAAALNEVAPKQWCDENAEKFEELAYHARIGYDRFIRTTDRDHVEAVEHFWFLLQEKGLLYETKHEGWYSVSDECFYPESQLVKHQEPYTGQVYMASAETKNKVEWVEEKNYCFRMTELRDRLLEFYENNPDWIQPAHRRNQVVDWVTNQLTDLSISRPVQRLSWGIRVPNDPSQTIYVWVDALINYLTASGYPGWTPGASHTGGWPADVQILGKDILRFHCVYWPALLMALDLPLPKKMLVHSHWTLNKTKMSKSLGNVVNPLYAINRWGIDTVRFYLLYEGGLIHDADYSNDTLVVKYKKYLQWGFGNLLGRLMRPKAWNTREIIEHAFNPAGTTEVELSKPLQETLASFEEDLTQLPSAVAKHMEQHNPVGAIRQIMATGTKLNEFLTQTQPWTLVKLEDPSGRATAEKILFLVAEGLRICGILLQPFLPEKATKLLDTLGASPDKRTFAHAALRCDPDYGVPMVDPGHGRDDGLFPPLIEDSDVVFPSSKKAKRKATPKAEIVMTEERLDQAHSLAIQEATASDRLTLEEEYENQQSWRASHDKLTFIICQPLSSPPVIRSGTSILAGEPDAPERMVGDVNLFLYPYEDDDEDDGVPSAAPGFCVGEVDIMIADQVHRGKGMGRGVVQGFLQYVARHVEGIMREYAEDKDMEVAPGLKLLMAKINQGNGKSIALFRSLGFEQEGEVNYFGEVKLVLRDLGRFAEEVPEGYAELVYSRDEAQDKRQ
ncbi:methionyl-tRNA synthetase [Collariella sp. IMI 366227]|nr:methionyl-tRNA synthetase [Collariella sp. IMI 366227]